GPRPCWCARQSPSRITLVHRTVFPRPGLLIKKRLQQRLWRRRRRGDGRRCISFVIDVRRARAGKSARGTLVHVVNRHLDTTPYASCKRVCRSPGRNWACCPSPTLVGLTTGAQSRRVPPSAASKIPQCVMVPQGPVASGNKMGILFVLTDGLSMVASSQVVESFANSTRSYALPTGSVKLVPSGFGCVVL